MLLRYWRLLTVLLVALLQGLAFAHVLERPAKMRYDASLYVTLQKTFYVQWGPPNFGAFLEPAAIIATIVLAVLSLKSLRSLGLASAAACALLLAFPVVFYWLVAPANTAFLNATTTTIPANWSELRLSWENGHTVRFALQFLALSLLVGSIVFDSHTRSTS